MSKKFSISPPADYLSFSPSELFRFFFQIGRWTEDSFSADFQSYTRGKLISTVTINKWKNRDVIPTRYSGPLFKMIQDKFDPNMATEWVIAFETVWAMHIARPERHQGTTRNSNYSDRVYHQHCDWIKSQHENEKLFGEPFSAADLYVPLQLIDHSKTLYDVEDLLMIFSSEDEMLKKVDWAFIRGGPGTGKSMAAIHLALEITKTNIFPIYLRGRCLSDIEIDIQSTEQSVIDSFSFKSFLQHFRASSQKTAYLILDGIDEIAREGNGDGPAFHQILKDLRLEQNVCRAHNKELKIIIFGRSSHVEFASCVIPPEQSLNLDILGLDGREHYSCDRRVLGQDLRPEWWARYLTATNREVDPILPNFLCSDFDDFSEFGSAPLLTYLICRLAFKAGREKLHVLAYEHVNALTHVNNRNVIYEDIIKDIHSRARFQNGRRLAFSQFFSFLQHIALSSWHHGADLNSSCKGVNDRDHDKIIEELFHDSNLTSSKMLINTVYNQTRDDNAKVDDAMIEFTHKTFWEYLASTLIFDRFQDLIEAFSAKNHLSESLENWQKISRAGEHEPSLAEFCQKEAELRYDKLSHLNWDVAIPLICDHLNQPQSNINGVEIISQTQRSASLLLFIWSCLNIERQKRTGEHFKLFSKREGFSSLRLKTIQLPNALNLDSGSLMEAALQHRTFLTQSMSGLEIDSTDMSQLSFSLGHMQSIVCRASSFAMTHWSHVKLTKSNFRHTSFKQAILHGNRWSESQFSDCLFQAVKIQQSSFSACQLKNIIFSQCHFSNTEFISTEMDAVIFDRCTFANCRFDTQANRETNDVKFRFCSFLDMETTLEKFMRSKFENCSFQTSARPNINVKKKSKLESQIEGLL